MIELQPINLEQLAVTVRARKGLSAAPRRAVRRTPAEVHDKPELNIY